MTSQAQKAQAFKALHEKDEVFIVANPWDAGSARLLQGLGFEALATTSAGFTQSLGRLDGEVSVDEKIDHCRALCAVTDIPITADFENGFSDSPEEAAANLVKVAGAGVVGGSIEDYSGSGIYDFELAVERIAACAEALSQLSFPFMLTARAENLLRVVNDLDDTIKRLQAFEGAGADDQVKQVLDSVHKPINVLFAFMPDVYLEQYAELGVRRISIGGALANLASGAILTASKQMLSSGSFNWVKEAAPSAELKALLTSR